MSVHCGCCGQKSYQEFSCEHCGEVRNWEGEIDRLRARLERAEWLLRGSLKFVLDPNLVRTVSVNHCGTRDDMANKIDAFLRGENHD